MFLSLPRAFVAYLSGLVVGFVLGVILTIEYLVWVHDDKDKP